MIDDKYIVDSHSHIAYEDNRYIIGSNYCWDIIPTLSEYEILAKKNNIKKTLFCPCTSPEIYDKYQRIKENSLLWEYRNNTFNYYSQITSENGIIKRPLEKNPYKKINDLICEYLKNYDNYYFVPAINIIYDTQEYLDRLIAQDAVALKVHGISIGLDSFEKINTHLLEYISKANIPLVIHTDYHVKTTKPIDILYNANNPIEWIKILKQYDIKGYLTHGCRLSKECAKMVSDSKGQFLVGISPDLLLESEQDRLMTKTENYLESLLEIFDEDYLSFDIDFGWNKMNRDTSQLDYNQLERTEHYIKDKKKLVKVLRKNSESFFKL